ncbi:MAG: LptF/LptG family permease [Crocinitomicaceae bacterium]|nr:LptF/LptG family permease [Crocinitomicaceae bacterium]MBK9592994.1 LptF/LptG family permease [Crocinitomicaceae bacterium]
MKKFLGTFVFMLFLLMSIAIVFDLSEKLNDFIDQGAPWSEIIGVYYVNFFIFFGVQFSYMLNFISVIWFTSKMASNTEIVPILSAGVGFNRFLRPYVFSSIILVIWAILMYNFVLPASNKLRLEFEEKYYRAKTSKANQHIQISNNEIVYYFSYDGQSKDITNMTYEKWLGDSLEYVLTAGYAEGDSLTNNWKLMNYEIRYFGEFNDKIIKRAKTDTTLSFGFEDLIFRSNVIEAMNNAELDVFIKEQEARGSDSIPEFLIEKHKRWASPFAIIILTLIGVAVSSKKTRGGLGLNLAIGLIICVLYIFSMQMTTVAAINVGFTPVIAVWLPNIIFAIIALFLLKIAPK